MKATYFLVLCFIITLPACQKNVSDFDPSQQPNSGSGTKKAADGGLIATIDGEQINFTVVSATLTHFPITNEKRMDIAAVSIDNTTKIVITLGEQISRGNEIAKKKYILNAFPVDDPFTPNINESGYSQGYTAYGTSNGVGWMFAVYNENGSFTVSSCDAAAKLISGNFETTLTHQSGIIKITSGNLTNVKYRIVN